MLILVGVGLKKEHITEEGRKYIEEAHVIYKETYTSVYPDPLPGKPLKRHDLEEGAERILEEARDKKVVILVPGDPLVATTHISLILEARKRGIETRVAPAPSIFTVAPGLCGLQIYKFGRTVTIPRFKEGFRPSSFAVHMRENLKRGLHTLALLDVDLSIREALKEVEEVDPDLLEETWVGIARGGEVVRAGKGRDLAEIEFGPLPHVLILVGSLHPLEKEALKVLAGLREP